MKDCWTGVVLHTPVGCDVAPGAEAKIVVRADGVDVLAFTPSRAEDPSNAHIDYTAFEVIQIWIGGVAQWSEKPTPATELFTQFQAPMDPVLPGLDVCIDVRNISDKAQPFAVALVGKVMR